MMEERTLERPAGADVGAALLDEYMELKGELGPLEKRLREVRDRLRDLVTEQGHFVDESRGVAVHVEARFRKEYDAERLVAVFPRLAGCVKSAADTDQLEGCLRAGMVTDTKLERQASSRDPFTPGPLSSSLWGSGRQALACPSYDAQRRSPSSIGRTPVECSSGNRRRVIA